MKRVSHFLQPPLILKMWKSKDGVRVSYLRCGGREGRAPDLYWEPISLFVFWTVFLGEPKNAYTLYTLHSPKVFPKKCKYGIRYRIYIYFPVYWYIILIYEEDIDEAKIYYINKILLHLCPPPKVFPKNVDRTASRQLSQNTWPNHDVCQSLPTKVRPIFFYGLWGLL